MAERGPNKVDRGAARRNWLQTAALKFSQDRREAVRTCDPRGMEQPLGAQIAQELAPPLYAPPRLSHNGAEEPRRLTVLNLPKRPTVTPSNEDGHDQEDHGKGEPSFHRSLRQIRHHVTNANAAAVATASGICCRMPLWGWAWLRAISASAREHDVTRTRQS